PGSAAGRIHGQGAQESAQAARGRHDLTFLHHRYMTDTLPDDNPADGAPRTKEDRHFVSALARGLEVLTCFHDAGTLLGNQEIAERSRLPKSTVSRLTYTLTKLGYLEAVPAMSKYRLGTAAVVLGASALTQFDIRRIAIPLMQELADFA